MQEVVLKSRSSYSFEKENEFWNKYLDVISSLAPRDQRLTQAEVDVLSYILAGNPYKSYFKGDLSKEIKEHFDISSNSLSQYKRKLINKGWLSDAEHGSAIIGRRLRAVQLSIKDQVSKNNSIDAQMIFSFKLSNETEGH